MTSTPKPDTTGENSGATSQGNPPKMTSSPQQIITSSIIVFTTDFTRRRRETSSSNKEFTSSLITSHDTFTEPVSISSVKSIASITTLDSTSVTSNSFGFSLETSTAVRQKIQQVSVR